MQYLSAAASLRLKYVCDRDSEMLNLEICMSGKSLLGFLKHTTNIWNYWYLVWAVMFVKISVMANLIKSWL